MEWIFLFFELFAFLIDFGIVIKIRITITNNNVLTWEMSKTSNNGHMQKNR